METKKVTPTVLRRMKERGEKIITMPVYDYPFAKILDECGVDVLLIGDSLSTTMMGRRDDIFCTLDEIILHTQAVARAAQRAMVIADMPFMSYQINMDEAKRNAGRLMQQGEADAVKIEGGVEVAETIRALVGAGIPVMGHIGYWGQALKLEGVRRVGGRTEEDRQRLLKDAKAVEEAGAFIVGLELMTVEMAQEITQMLKVPTSGMGSGPIVTGPRLNIYDVIGLSPPGFAPKICETIRKCKRDIAEAVKQFMKEVKDGSFPDEEHSFH